MPVSTIRAGSSARSGSIVILLQLSRVEIGGNDEYPPPRAVDVFGYPRRAAEATFESALTGSKIGIGRRLKELQRILNQTGAQLSLAEDQETRLKEETISYLTQVVHESRRQLGELDLTFILMDQTRQDMFFRTLKSTNSGTNEEYDYLEYRTCPFSGQVFHDMREATEAAHTDILSERTLWDDVGSGIKSFVNQIFFLE